MGTARPCKVLMVHPTFSAGTMWQVTQACEVFGAKYPTAPLGLITVAALLPGSWTIRLVDCNCESLGDDAIDWADLVMVGGMLSQHFGILNVIERCQARGKPVAIGGPAVTSHPELYAKADFQICGEVEDIIDGFVQTWELGSRHGTFQAEKFKVDVTSDLTLPSASCQEPGLMLSFIRLLDNFVAPMRVYFVAIGGTRPAPEAPESNRRGFSSMIESVPSTAPGDFSP